MRYQVKFQRLNEWWWTTDDASWVGCSPPRRVSTCSKDRRVACTYYSRRDAFDMAANLVRMFEGELEYGYTRVVVVSIKERECKTCKGQGKVPCGCCGGRGAK